MGHNEGKVTVEDCYNTGMVNGADGAQDVGGVVGNNVLSEIGNCYYEEGTASKGCGSSPDGSSEAGLTQGTPTTWDDDRWEMSEWLGRPVLKENRLTVTFDYNYKDKDGKPQRVEYYVDYGSGFGTKPDFPEREGYVPKGWFEGGSEVGDDYFSSDEIITGNRIFTVQWELKEYKITYEIGDDGVNDERNPSKYTIEDEIEELYPASKEGYNFMGWYENEECTGDPVTKFGPGETGDKTFYATPIRVTVKIPEELRRANREFAIVRVHNGAAKILEDADGSPDTITILTDKFSTYSIVYRSAEASDSNPNTGITVPITVTALASAIIVAAVTVKKKKTKK